MKLSRVVAIGAGAAALLIVGLSLWVASQEWFFGDDFHFLLRVQHPEVWSWLDIYVPTERRQEWFYRPLGMDTFYYLAFGAFGFEALGYFIAALVVHFAGGFVVYRLTMQTGFDPSVAVVTALLAVSRQPALTEIASPKLFHYVAASLLALLTVSLFLDFARGSARQAGSTLALALALLCNEYTVSVAPVLLLVSIYADDAGLNGAALLRAVRRTGPHLALAGGFLVLRLLWLAPLRDNDFYTPQFGVGMLRNAGILVVMTLGEGAVPLAAGSLFVALLASALAHAEGRRLLGQWWLPVCGIFLPWAAGTALLFGQLPFPQQRFAIPLAPPLCLLFGSAIHVFWCAHPRAPRRLLEVALVAILLLSLPYAGVSRRARAPVGAAPQRLWNLLEAHHPAPPEGTRVVLRYGGQRGEGLAAAQEARPLRRLLFGQGFIRARYPDRDVRIQYLELGKGPRGPCARCIQVDVLPGRHFRLTEE